MTGPQYIVVGRSRDCDLVVADASVSGRHARLTWKLSNILVEDLGSANGTFVDGRRVDRAVIRPGADLRLGKTPLPWSDPSLRPFLRDGARGDTVVGMAIPGRRFICGACGNRGVLPQGFKRGELKCSACASSLVVGRTANAGMAVALGTMLSVALLGGAVWTAFQSESRSVLDTAVERLGISSSEGPDTGSQEEKSVRLHTAPLVVRALDASDSTTRNSAVRVAAEDEGPFRLEQVARLWTHVRGRWKYVNDPRGGEYFASASETIENEFAGDCDDFAIVLAAMITAIGGEARVVMMDGPAGGHAYAEACIQEPASDTAKRLAGHYRRNWDRYLGRQRVQQIHFRSSEQCPVWLNLDWNAGVPGGSYGSESWAVAIYPGGATETLLPSRGDARPGLPSPVPAQSAQPPR